MSYSREKQIAVEAVTVAAKLCTTVQAELVQVGSLQKGDRSPVTVADFGSQAVVCRHLRAAFPADVIVAEEDSAQLRQPENSERLHQVHYFVRQIPAHGHASPDDICRWIDAGNGRVTERFWTLDPIDGTKGFLRSEQYAIALALIENGQVQVAALACPALPLDLNQPDGATGVVFVAVRGQGAQMAALGSADFQPVQVVAATDSARLRFVESVEAGHGDQPLQKAIAAAAGITAPSLRMDSQVKYGAVARGDAALYLRLPSPKSPNYREKIWDHAAGSLIIDEAGGRVTDMHGQPLDFAGDYKMNDNRGVVASSGQIHDAVLAALRENR
jgi:3'(2'), 5'-bisphosphate nucleotidase